MLRHKRLILRVTALFGLLALVFVVVRHDSYTAITKLLIDNKTLQLSRQDAVFARSEVDVPLIQNQIELLRSEKIANHVIDKFDLVDDPDFGARGAGVFSLASRDPDERRRLALEAFRRRLYVGRIGDSYTLEIRFTAGAAQQAAEIANQIGTDYIALLTENNAKLAQSASPWLRPRLLDMGLNASVITSATPPLRKDGPGSLVILSAALLAGLIFGVTTALAADVRDRTIRTPAQAVATTGTECLGIVPQLQSRNLLFEAAKAPRSHLAHTLRRAVAAIREQPDTRIVGVVSALPREGRSTIAANLGQVAANSGSRVLLIDAAAYSGELSRVLAPDSKAGLADVVGKKLAFASALWGVSHLKFLPLGGPSQLRLDRPGSVAELQSMFEEASTAFDLVVVDLPPLALVADVREVAAAFDGFLLVAAWGRTPQDVITSALAINEPIRRKLLGVILNRVEIESLRTYDDSLSVIYDRTSCGMSTHQNAMRGRWRWFASRNKGAA